MKRLFYLVFAIVLNYACSETYEKTVVKDYLFYLDIKNDKNFNIDTLFSFLSLEFKQSEKFKNIYRSIGFEKKYYKKTKPYDNIMTLYDKSKSEISKVDRNNDTAYVTVNYKIVDIDRVFRAVDNMMTFELKMSLEFLEEQKTYEVKNRLLGKYLKEVEELPFVNASEVYSVMMEKNAYKICDIN